MSDFDAVGSQLLARLDHLIDRLEPLLPAAGKTRDFDGVHAFRWRRQGLSGYLHPILRPHRVTLADLVGVERQKAVLVRNTEQFVRGFPANNVLLWGSRGTGKSSIIKALLNAYAPQGLRLIEVEKQDLTQLPEIVHEIEYCERRFVLFCDDLSFEADDPSYKALKAVLDGSVSAAPENVLIYATSNRRHLLPEYFHENLEAKNVDGEIHQGESVEEKISLSERFGLWLSFYPFDQSSYLEIVHHWVAAMGGTPGVGDMRAEALRWALGRGSRSGRSAYQFARDWVGKSQLQRQ